MDAINKINENKMNNTDTFNTYVKKFVGYSCFAYLYATDNITNLPMIVLCMYGYSFFSKCIDTCPLITY